MDVTKFPQDSRFAFRGWQNGERHNSVAPKTFGLSLLPHMSLAPGSFTFQSSEQAAAYQEQ